MANKRFKQYYKRLAKEGIMKSLLCGLIVGFSALFLSATVFWIVGVKQVWIVAIVFAVAVGIATPLFYYKRFKPTTKKIAERVDALGLEERILTMTELEGDTSYIAMRQREDALNALKTVHAGLVPLAISTSLIIATIVSGGGGALMTTISVLAANNVIKSGLEIVNPSVDETAKDFEVLYEIEEGEGEIVGDAFQLVTEGEDAMPVMAVPEDGWAFVEWSDGSEDPYREDLNITKDLTIYAVFGQLQEGDGEDGDEGDEAGDQPKEGEKEGENEGDGENAGGEYVSNNQVIDGETTFDDAIYENAYEDALNDMNESGDYSDEEKDVVGGYFDSVKK